MIYLDCDVLVNMDIRDLWEIETGGNYVAAVVDEGLRKQKLFSVGGLMCWINCCKPSAYFNSGVLLMNLAEIRGMGNFFALSVEWFKYHPHTSEFGDQDALNALFFGKVKLIDSRFNRHKGLEDSDLSNSIIHMI
ncbi:MAG: hypothetical protein IJP86_01780 [Synergistaceae bacterium]|nr:hypothetical protein [Synergistaceae bacterium]